tara:strand:- start:24958 stop:25212 length:255 start_codon:yes stop_codon:yes gene_type:complete
MNITVDIKVHYGQTRVYVVGFDHARHLEDLTGTSTLTKRHISALGMLGHTFTVRVNSDPQMAKYCETAYEYEAMLNKRILTNSY